MRPSHRTGISAATLTATMSLLAAASVSTADEPLEKIQTIALKGPVGGLDHLAFDSARGRLFVANTSNNTLDVVDVKAGTLLKQVPDQGRARGVAYSPEADRVFVGCGTGGVCSVLDGKTYDVLKAIPLGTDADNVRYNPRTRRIYVVHADTELSVIDAEDYTLRSPIALPKSLGAFQLEAGRPRMYINAKAEGIVVALNSENDRIISRYNVAPAGVPAAVAIDEPNRRLFVGCRREPSLVAMESDSGKVVARVPIPGDVDDMSSTPSGGESTRRAATEPSPSSARSMPTGMSRFRSSRP
jgi:DNA-binding beta-propeller fold protein YncE